VFQNAQRFIPPTVDTKQKEHYAHLIEQLMQLFAKYVVQFCIFVKSPEKL